jgi:hypothetical protein
MRLTTLFPLLVLGALVGCPQPKEDDTASADTDTDTDADADADTDADVTEVDAAAAADIDGATAGYEYAYDVMLDATMDGSSLDGTLTYTYAESGSTVCDFTDHVVGTEYSGSCSDCDFAFDIASTNTTDNSTSDCVESPTLSLRGSSIITDLWISGISTFETDYGNYYDVFRAGFGYDYTAYGYGVYPGPYYSYLAYDGGYYGSADWDETSLQWTFSSSGTATDLGDYYYYCDYNYTYYVYSVYPGSGGTGSLDCEGADLDTWTFEAVDGATAYVTVDTTSDATAFDPHAWVRTAARLPTPTTRSTAPTRRRPTSARA